MPYLEAFTNEVHRKSSILPMSVYHKVQKDCGKKPSIDLIPDISSNILDDL